MNKLLTAFLLALTLAVGAAHAAKTKPAQWEALYDQSDKLYFDGQRDESYAVALKALRAAEKAKGVSSPEAALCLANLGMIQQGRGQGNDAEVLLKRSLAMYEKTLGPDDIEVAGALDRLAELYSMGRNSENEPLYKRALAIREKALGLQHRDVGVSLYSLGLFYATQKKFAQAEPLYERALTIWEKEYGRESPEIIRDLNDLGDVYAAQEKFTQAEAQYRRGLKIAERTYAPNHYRVTQGLKKLAEVCRKTGRASEAETLEKRLAALPQ